MVQLGAAGAAMVGGAYLIAVWVVGLVLMLEAVFYVVVVWDDGKPKTDERSGPDRILEAYKRAR